MFVASHLSLCPSGQRKERLSFHVCVCFSIARTLTLCFLLSLCLTGGDVAFLLSCLLLPAQVFSPLPAPLCCSSSFYLHSTIQMMSGTMTVRTKATGFPRFMKNRGCLTEAASKNRPQIHQQQLVRVKLSKVAFVSQRKSFHGVEDGDTGKAGCFDQRLSQGINKNLSFSACAWKGHLIISHIASGGIYFQPEICPYCCTADMTLTVAPSQGCNLLSRCFLQRPSCLSDHKPEFLTFSVFVFTYVCLSSGKADGCSCHEGECSHAKMPDWKIKWTSSFDALGNLLPLHELLKVFLPWVHCLCAAS